MLPFITKELFCLLGPHAGLWLPPRALGISHILVIVPAAFEAEIPVPREIWYSDQRLASGTDQGQTMLQATSLPVFSSPALHPLCFSPFFSQLCTIPHQAGSWHSSAPERLGPEAMQAQAVWISSGGGGRDPPSPPCHSLKDRSDKSRVVTTLRACEGTQHSPSWHQVLEDQMQIWLCQQGGHGRRADGGKVKYLSHLHYPELYDVPWYAVQLQSYTAISMEMEFTSKQACCFSHSDTARPVCHRDSEEGGKERRGWPTAQGTARAMERGSG